MLRVGLTGGIGAGKSTVAARLAERGAVLVDADSVARDVVAPGTTGLQRVVEEFGPRVLTPAGALDRTAVAGIVFADHAARGRLNAIVHPLVAERSEALAAAAPEDAVVVQDIPLLVENRLAPAFHLVIVVHAEIGDRVLRLVQRGMSEADARARMSAQADDAARGSAADVWLVNGGAVADLQSAVDRLWTERLLPFEKNLRQRRPAPAPPPRLITWDPTWPEQAARLAARVAHARGAAPEDVQHVGATAVPGLPARDMIELALAVDSPVEDAADLPDAGFPVSSGRYRSADPGRPAEVRVCPRDSPEWRAALLARDWLGASAEARADYATATRTLARRYEADPDPDRYVLAEQAWLRGSTSRMRAWADASGWPAVADSGA